MIRRITIENYMSHEKTVIEPGDGLTVLIGPNNCGKSAVVSALQALCFNKKGKSVIRHDQKEARVTLDFENDGQPHCIIWTRKEGSASYLIDGRPVHRLNRDVPDDLPELLRLNVVKPTRDAATDECFDIHFASQKSPLFLLDGPPSRAASFFSASNDAQKLMEMQRVHHADVIAARRDVKRLDSEVLSLQESIANLAVIDLLAQQAAQLDDSAQAWRVAHATAAALEKHLVQRRGTQRRARRHFESKRALEPLKGPPAPSPTQSLSRIIVQMQAFAIKKQRTQQTVVVTQPLAGVPEMVATRKSINSHPASGKNAEIDPQESVQG